MKKNFNNLNSRGKFIVIEGVDGSGKQTQSQLLVDYLNKEDYKVKFFDFPRYFTFYGKIVSRFLAGEFGKMEEVSPYLISLAYALDRASAKEEMEEWLKSGRIIVSNRYVASSMAHQVARIKENKKREFIEWLDELEYKINKIPREDIVIYLYVPWKIGLELTQKKGEREYTNGKKLDIAEANIRHRLESEKMYLYLLKERKNWVMINSIKNGKLRTREEIHKEIVKKLKEEKIIH